MGKTVVFTSAATNYLPKVRKLFTSIRRHHPEFEVVLALADKRSDWIDYADEPLDRVIAVEDLAIPDRSRWTYFHTIVELATAIKPFVLQRLLDEPGVDRVLYFDPDMVLFSRLDDLLARLDNENLVLTPHLVEPEDTLDAVRDNEIAALKHGIYNLGFVGVRANDEGKRFAKWWGDRVYHFCVDDIPSGLFTDQRWIDLAPAFFDGVGILKSPRFNVATWNITKRRIEGSVERGFLVNGEPLGFYHFTGFDSGAHDTMADKHAAGQRPLRELIDWYSREARFDDADPAAKVTWAFGCYDDGSPIAVEHRRIYRERTDLQEAFPDPFSIQGGLLGWMKGQGELEYPERLAKKKLHPS